MEMDRNLSVYQSGPVVRQYARAVDAELTAQEKLCLGYVPEAGRGTVLDIGVGAGRTVGPLSRMFRSYTGIDYSAPMIEEARRRFPDRDLRVMDARKLAFAHQFDCVFFSYNGIDYMSFDDRSVALMNIRNALRPDGIFIFSTHNLHHTRARVWLRDLLVRELAPPGLLQITLPHIRGMLMRAINYWRQREDRARGFACINDPAHGFSIITVYVDIDRQVRALEQMGFSLRAAIGSTKTMSDFDERDGWVYLVAQRA
jgi:SAM-dependent methyltransferase